MDSMLAQGLPVNSTSTTDELACTYGRTELIGRIGVLAETHLLALKNVVDEEVFEGVCDFPVELIGQTVNGYQRFLAELGNGKETAQVVAGMIIRMRAALLYEFGPDTLRRLQAELIGLTSSQLEEAVSRRDIDSLWSVANPTLRQAEISRSWDLLATFLFISHAKWLLVRAAAAMEPDQKTKK